MKLSLAFIAATTIAVAEAGDASSKWANLRRRLSFEKVAGYSPDSQVRLCCLLLVICYLVISYIT